MDVIKINFSSCIRDSKHGMKTSPSVYMYLEMEKKNFGLAVLHNPNSSQINSNG